MRGFEEYTPPPEEVLSKKDYFIAVLRCCSETSPIVGGKLARTMDWPDTTYVRAMVSYLRSVSELPIGSNSKGYFWARKPEQLNSTIGHLEARIQKEQAVVRSLRRAQGDLERDPLQPRLI